MSSAAEEHVRARIAAAPVAQVPFEHWFLTSIFPEDYYLRLLDALPPLEAYSPISDGGTVAEGQYAQRYVCDVEALEAQEVERGAGGFWTELAAWLLGEPFKDLVLESFRIAITRRYGENVILRTETEARLVRDFTGYAIGPHTDSPRKLVSLLFYLPRDERLRELGTSIYVPIDADFRCDKGLHYGFERFRQVARAPYIPNALLAFAKSDQSFHGVEHVSEPGIERNLLLYNVYVTKVVAAPAPAKPAARRWPWQNKAS